MVETAAARAALDLLHLPMSVRRAKTAPLPDGVVDLLLIVAGDAAFESELAHRMQRPARELSNAAAFFIEQVMLQAEADSYRVLGVSPTAPISEIRRNMALLLRWLHPDVAKNAGRRALIDRVTAAWENLKTPERRAAYDLALRLKPKPQKVGTPRSIAKRAVRLSAVQRTRALDQLPAGGPHQILSSLLNRSLLFLLGRSRPH